METRDLIRTFKGKWLLKAREYLYTPRKIQTLISEVQNYILKKGLKDFKDDVILMMDYLKDIYSGKYKDYNSSSLLLVIAVLIYLVSPIDAIPDVLPVVGLTDDVTVIMFVFKEMKDELERYKIKK